MCLFSSPPASLQLLPQVLPTFYGRNFEQGKTLKKQRKAGIMVAVGLTFGNIKSLKSCG